MEEPLAGKNIQKTLRVQLLGGFSVSVDGQSIPEEQWKSRRGRSLVKLLALAPAHRLHRDQVIDSLWPDSDLTAAANNFHQTLHAARKVLEPAGAGALLLEEGFLNLSAGTEQVLWVDVEQFEAAAARARDSQDPGLVQAALDFYQGGLLPDDLYEEWTIQRRETLRQTYLTLLLELARLLEERQEYPQAVETLQRLLAADRSSEEAHIQLMRLYALSGQRQQALRQYQSLGEALRADLDIEPSEPAARLYEAIQANRFPPAAASGPAAGKLHNLPAELTSFIGREQETGEVCQQVRQQRLVTLTGSGGTGKTRLALHAAAQLLEYFPDGVWLIELAPVTDPDIVVQEVASRLGLQRTTSESHLALLVNYLRGKKLLLLLDNCEHLLDACAQLATHLLQQCPQISLLTTSREALGIAGETAYRVPSLAAPDPERFSGTAELGQVESVRLFAERAAAVQSGFSLSPENLAAVGRICHRLDGIPLAIELAAARVGVLSVEQIAARLDDRFRLLTGGSRTALPRQRTLRASIDWSYSLLADPERLLLQRLSVFSGGWTLAAAEAVCAGDGLEQWEILDALAGLVNKSLAAADNPSGLERRYAMLETIRQYAQERLEDTGMGAAVRDRHLDYFLALAEEYEPLLRTPQIFELLERLDLEVDNLRGAIVWALGRNDRSGAEKALKIVCSLFYYWLLRFSLFSEVEDWVKDALKLLPDDDPQAVDLRTWSLLVLAMLAATFSNFQERLEYLNACIALCRQAGTPASRQKLAFALAERKHTIREYNFFRPPDPSFRLVDAQRDGDESLLIAQELLLADDPVSNWFVCWIYFLNAFAENFSVPSYELDPLEKDRINQMVRFAHAKSIKFGDKVSELNTLYILDAKDETANALNRKYGIDLARRLGNKDILGNLLSSEGELFYNANQFLEMEENFREVLLICRQGGFEGGATYAARNIGIAALHQADFTKAQSFLATALDWSIAHQDDYGVLSALIFFAGLALLVQQNQPAVRLLGFVECQLEGFFKPMDPIDQIEFKRYSTEEKEKLGEAAFTSLWAEGRAMTMDQAVQMARAIADFRF